MAVRIIGVSTKPAMDNFSNQETWTNLWINPQMRSAGIVQENHRNGVPYEEYVGLIVTHELEGRPDEDDAWKYLNSADGQELLGRICDGHYVCRDSRSNLVGGLDDEATEALDELVEALEEMGTNDPNEWSVWEVDEWVVDPACDETTSDEELEDIAMEVEEDAEYEHVVLNGSVLDFLTRYRDEMRRKAEE